MTEPVNGEGKKPDQVLLAEVYIEPSGTVTLRINGAVPDKVKFLLELSKLALKGIEEHVAKERTSRAQIQVPRLKVARR